MNSDFATLYISDDLDLESRINKGVIYTELLNYLKSKGIRTETVDFQNKKGYNIKENYIDFSVNPNIHWRIILNIKTLENYKKLFISFRPVFKDQTEYKFLKGKEVEEIAKKDVEYIQTHIGESFLLNFNGRETVFSAFSYSTENKIDIGRWEINFNKKLIDYDNVSSGLNVILSEIEKIKPFSFRVIDLSNGQANRNAMSSSIISKLEKYGKNLNNTYNAYDYSEIGNLPNTDGEIINIILINKNDSQSYMDSKEFFLNKNLPFQHIIIDGKLNDNNNSYAFNMAVMEIYKKTHTHDFYLRPDHFINEKIAGFIYFDADAVLNKSNGKYSKLFTFSYIMSQNVDYLRETLASTGNLNIHSKKDYLNIIDVEEAGRFIEQGNTVASNDEKDPFYFNIVVTKKLNNGNMLKLIDTLKNEGILINRVYYISTRMLGFADNLLYTAKSDFEIPYKVLGKNIAVIKVATNKFLYPQLFSTYAEILYPKNCEISEVDIKNILWLSKKRIYRVQSLNHMTKLEPVSLKEKNLKLLESIKGSLNINYLI